MPVINDYNHCDEFTCVALAGELSHGITKLPNYNCSCATIDHKWISNMMQYWQLQIRNYYWSNYVVVLADLPFTSSNSTLLVF